MGIVYTIYESIGKSVVVPHCGSKTINVRLTVSPEGKSKSQSAAAAAATSTAATANTCINNSNINSNSNNNSSSTSKLKKLPAGMAAAMSAKAAHGGGVALTTSGGARRQHRHRPRKLIKSDDEDDDSNSDKEKELAGTAAGEQQAIASGNGRPSKSSRYQKNNAKLEQCCIGHQQLPPEQHTPDNGHNTYENMLNLKCCSGANNKEAVGVDIPDCPLRPRQHQQHHSQDVYMKQATQRVKMLRRARKQKVGTRFISSSASMDQIQFQRFLENPLKMQSDRRKLEMN